MEIFKQITKAVGEKAVQTLQELHADLKEIGQDVSYTADKLGGKLREIRSREPSPPQWEGSDTPQTAPPDPRMLREQLTEEMDRAIHRAYYQEGGFRFFGLCLQRYVQVVLPEETDGRAMWAEGYNTCIQPMCRQQEQLEDTLQKLLGSGLEPLALKNRELREKMAEFAARAEELRVPGDPDTYKSCLKQYSEELDRQLLTVYKPPEEI